MRNRRLLAVPAALLLSVVFAGTALATHCGNTSKPDGAGQHVVLLVDPVTEDFTLLAGANRSGKFTGGFADVYIDLDRSGTVSSGDLKINDTFLLSMHSGLASPGQNDDGLAVLPAIRAGEDPAGAARGAGFASVSFVP